MASKAKAQNVDAFEVMRRGCPMSKNGNTWSHYDFRMFQLSEQHDAIVWSKRSAMTEERIPIARIKSIHEGQSTESFKKDPKKPVTHPPSPSSGRTTLVRRKPTISSAVAGLMQSAGQPVSAPSWRIPMPAPARLTFPNQRSTFHSHACFTGPSPSKLAAWRGLSLWRLFLSPVSPGSATPPTTEMKTRRTSPSDDSLRSKP